MTISQMKLFLNHLASMKGPYSRLPEGIEMPKLWGKLRGILPWYPTVLGRYTRWATAAVSAVTVALSSTARPGIQTM